MNTETVRHSLIASRMLVALYRRVSTAGFEAARGKLKIVANGQERCPDVIVFPGSDNMDSDTIHHPIVVVEVVSASTRVVDRFDKNVDYASTPSVQHYIMLSDERRAAILCSRTSDGWTSVELDHSDTLTLPAIGVDLPLEEVYRGIAFRSGPA